MVYDERNGFPMFSDNEQERLIQQNMGMLGVRVRVKERPTSTDTDIARATVATAGLLQALAAPSGADDLRETDLVTCLRQALQATTTGVVTREAPLNNPDNRWPRIAAADLAVRGPDDTLTVIEAKWINDGSPTAWAYVLYDIVKLAIIVASGTARSAYLVIGGRLDRAAHDQITRILDGDQWDDGRLLHDTQLWHASRGTSAGPPQIPTSIATVPVGSSPIHVVDDPNDWSLLAITVLASRESWAPAPEAAATS